MKRAVLVFLLCAVPTGAIAQSTSPDPRRFGTAIPQQEVLDASQTITFSEYPVGTPITDQYRTVGILFGGSGPFISWDGANPTSPVLSGTPLFQGDITGRFVEPGTDNPTVVKAFTLDAGYFDAFGSTRIEWFDPSGRKLGQRINSHLGIERFTIEGGDIASWTISIVQNEPAGFAIDNVSFEPIGPSILFRELSSDRKDGTWGDITKDEIPGFDHCAIQVHNRVYESHPGYPSGVYVSEDGAESITITELFGVQAQHSRATFKHDSQSQNATNVVHTAEIPIDDNLAENMKNAAESALGAPFQRINFSSISGIQQTLSPSVQKGGNGAYTCVGLVEWAAETAGEGGGQGFIPNRFESFRINTILFGSIEIPLLSPQLLYWSMTGANLLENARQWIQGLFDPLDFVLVDPLGRRLGYVAGTGLVNEIPNAFFSGNGTTEQLVIPTAIPGNYQLQLVGQGADALASLSASGSETSFLGMLETNDHKEKSLFVHVTPGCTGDVNGNGKVDEADVQALQPLLNTFTDGLGHPGDLDGDGLISDSDIGLLRQLIKQLAEITISIDILPDSEDNPINPRSKGVIPVAILGSPSFNVVDVDIPSVVLGTGSEADHADEAEDINGDGFLDLVLHFRTQDVGVSASDSELRLEGNTKDGAHFSGVDHIRVVGILSQDKAIRSPITYVSQPFPNPARSSSTIEYQLSTASNVRCAVYDISGHLVRSLASGLQQEGLHRVEWDGRNELGQKVPNGIYFFTFETPDQTRTSRLVFMK